MSFILDRMFFDLRATLIRFLSLDFLSHLA